MRLVRVWQPMAAHVARASHQRGPTPGLIQPVTGVKRLPAPRSLKSHLRIFPRPLREPCLLPTPRPINPALPCPTNQQQLRGPRRRKKGPFPRLTRAIRFVRQGSSETSSRGHSQRLDYLVPVRLQAARNARPLSVQAAASNLEQPGRL